MSVLRAPVITALALLIVSAGYDGQSGSASARSTSLLQQLLTTSRREAAEHHARSTEHQAHAPLQVVVKSDYSTERNEVNKSNQHDQTLAAQFWSACAHCSLGFLFLACRSGNLMWSSAVVAHAPSLDVFPRDLRQKEKFLKHLTGPLYFSPKCSKHFYRLYHNTRDCTIPAYYRRCARLLRRLAESQRCSEG